MLFLLFQSFTSGVSHSAAETATHHAAIHVYVAVETALTAVEHADASVHHAGRVAAHGVVVEEADNVVVAPLAGDIARKSVQMIRDFHVGVVTQENRGGFV